MKAARSGKARGASPRQRPRDAGSKAPRGDVIGVGVDDSGLVPGVAETVAELAAMGRVSMTSCVVNGPHWNDASRVLVRVLKATPRFECGLHFNLTEGTPLSAELQRVWPTLPSLERVMVDAHLHRLTLDAVAAEWRAQCRAFTTAMGRAPAFVDGHQHVHALPGIRDLLLADLRTWPRVPAVRNTGRLLGPGHAVKRLVIEGTGGRALQRRLADGVVPHNAVMIGVYGFETADYGAMVRRWLAAAPRAGGLLMCHPLMDRQLADAAAATATGSASADAWAVDGDPRRRAHDPIASARAVEAIYLASDDFAHDLAAARFTVGAPWLRRTTSAG